MVEPLPRMLGNEIFAKEYLRPTPLQDQPGAGS
jgi:hypothetical protein